MINSDFKRLILLWIAIAVSLSASSVHAKKKTMADSDYVDFSTPPAFYVKSNGQKYTELSRQKHPLMFWQIPALFSYDAPGKDVIKSYHLQLRMAWIAGSKTDNFAGSHVSKNFGRRKDRPKSIHTNVSFALNGNDIESFLVSACNARADGLRNNGLNNKQIFGQKRQVDAKIYASSAIDIQNVPGASFDSPGVDFQDRFAKIICMKAPAPTVDTANSLNLQSAVTDASLTIIQQSTVGGACKLNLSTVIKTNLPNTTVKYRFEHVNGKKSDIKTVKTSHTKTAMDAHWYDVPYDPNKSEAGSIRIIGVSHNFKSAWKSYNMTCNAPAPSGLALVTKPTVKLDITPINNIMHKGMICPTKLRITAALNSPKAFSGTGSVTIKDNNYAFASHDVNLSPNITWKHFETYNLKPWNTVNAPAGMAGGSNTFQSQPGANHAAPFQRFEIRYHLTANQKNVLTTPFKTVSVRCRPAKVNSKLPGSAAVGIRRKHTGNGSAPVKPQLKGQVKPQSTGIKRPGAPTKLFKGKLGQQCKRGHFPKNAVIKQAGRQRIVECINGKVRLKPAKTK